MTRDQRRPHLRTTSEPLSSPFAPRAEGALAPHVAAPPEVVPTDAEIVRRIANGNVEALGTLYDRHARALLGFARRLTSNEDAEDVVQNVFLRVVASANRFDPSATSAKPWLVGIAVHVVRERRRKVVRFARALLRMSTLRPPSREPSADRTDVERALAKLSLAKREVLLLVEVEELTCEEAASTLGIPIGTVWTRLHHARRELKSALGETP